ncbi:MAG: hypothetical protein D6702_02625 [Planctomycetota bacterium]|nr:MAG: hypothetical protein D6702_02625 [Planctomycetota bacterium]
MSGATVATADLVGRRIRSERRVEFLDCDAYRHLSATGFLRFAIDHRFTATFDAFGLASPDTAVETGIAWPIVRCEMDFLAEASLGEVLVVESWIDRLSASSLEAAVRIRRKADERDCCRMRLVLVPFDLASRRAVPVPDRLPVRRIPDLDTLPWAEGHPRTP